MMQVTVLVLYFLLELKATNATDFIKYMCFASENIIII